jgi:hypothetical protein
MFNFENLSAADRDLLAFRYIADELSDEEAVALEAALETSQSAREAVARAVELSQAIALAEMQQVELVEAAGRSIGRRKSWAYGLGLVGAGAAAASVAGLVWWSSQSPETDTPELAELWTESRSVEPQPVVPEVSILELSPVLDSADAAIAPSWMMAGVISQSGGKVEEDLDGDGKPDESWDDEVVEN